ncbi:MAG TPA: hypothetical protein VFQ34_14620, partial [Nitrospiraceae bacterium]|nr:hypothetical protein [Nitrospiraceae bacterium]
MTYSSRYALLSMLLACGVLVGACSHTLPETTRKPVPPPLTSAAPSFAAVNKEQPRPPVSQLPVQVKTDLTPVVSAIRQAVPERITEAGHPLANDYRWTFVRNGDPEVQIQDGLVAVHSEYRGDIETRLGSSGCRLNPVYPVVDTNGKLVLVQDRDAVSLAFEPTQTMVSLRPDGDNRCNMFNVPVKDKMAEVMGADQLTRALADSVQPQTFALPLQRIWDSLNAPLAVPVSTQNAKACLYGQPAEISLDGLKGTTENATISGL